MKKIVFISYHNWSAKRQGGFHKLAESAALEGYKTIFYSYPRPWYSLFRNTETFNLMKVLKLLKGINYSVKNETIVHNITSISFGLPIKDKYKYLIPSVVLGFFDQINFPSISHLSTRTFKDTDLFILESTSCVLLFKYLKNKFPKAKFIYRPSDPLIAFDHGRWLRKAEWDVLNRSDLTLLVNQEGEDLYSKLFLDFNTNVNRIILPNGVDIASFTRNYSKPSLLIGKTALYVGVMQVNWDLIFWSAKTNPDISFVIICPVPVKKSIILKINRTSNIYYVPGVDREDVAKWVTNCDVFIVPYLENWYKKYPWGITAKYYQAMAAQKPIVAYHDSAKLNTLGINVTYDFESFDIELLKSIRKDSVKYDFDWNSIDWYQLGKRFHEALKSLN